MRNQIKSGIRCTKTPEGNVLVFKKGKDGKAFGKGIVVNPTTKQVVETIDNTEDTRRLGLRKWKNYQEVDPQPYMVELLQGKILPKTNPEGKQKKPSYKKPHTQQPFGVLATMQ